MTALKSPHQKEHRGVLPDTGGDWITPAQAAKMIGVTRQTLSNWRTNQKPGQPKFHRWGPKSIRYRKSDIEAWIRSHVVEF